MSLTVKYMDAPVGAQETAAAAVTSRQPFGTAEQLVKGSADMPWATLEPGSWALNGSRKLLPDGAAGIGWWSTERSGEDGRFVEPPIITVKFDQLYTATGITFWFWPSLEQWCREIQVIWYSGETQLAEVIAFPDAAQWVLEQAVEGFDKIEIHLLATNVPGQFAKIQQIQIGHVVVFGSDELVRVSLLNEMDPSLCNLSVDAMTVEIRDRKSRTLIPQKNQSMFLYRAGKQLAAHYITDSSRETQQYYTFQCQSAIGRLEDTYLGGLYSGTSAAVLLGDILGAFSYALDDAFANQTVTGYLPVCTRREALQQLAFAIGAVVSTREDGVIRLNPLQDSVGGVFTGNDIFSGAKVSREAQTAAVQIYAHSYTPGTEEETLLENETVSGTGLLYVFSEPHHSYILSGGSLASYGENWVRITAEGTVTLKGKKYVHATSVRTKTNPMATAAEKGNVVSVENATLIHTGNVDGVLERLYVSHGLKNLLTQEAVISNQNAGQLVESINPWGDRIVGYITSMESEFTGTGQTASVTIRGREEKMG